MNFKELYISYDYIDSNFVDSHRNNSSHLNLLYANIIILRKTLITFFLSFPN